MSKTDPRQKAPAPSSKGLLRRGFLAAMGAGVVWARVFRISPAEAQPNCPPPPNFPSSIPLYQQAYENWVGAIHVDNLWTCTPGSAADVVAIANWARENGYTVRPRGSQHGWSPLTVTPGSTCNGILLVDTTQSLTQIEMVSSSPGAVRVEAGVMMDELLVFLEAAGYGLAATPAPGDITVGGALAIDAHGATVGAEGETPAAGQTYGSLSNLVVSLTAVVWEEATSRYVLRTFSRSEPDCKAFLTHLGRAFVTEVTLRVAANYNLRCVSYVDIPASELFAAPSGGGGSGLPVLPDAGASVSAVAGTSVTVSGQPAVLGGGAPRTFASFIESTGRAEAIWFPFTDKPWLKVWSVSPTQPVSSRETTSPYNYPFSDNIPKELTDLANQVITGHQEVTPVFGQTAYNVSVAGLAATASYDLWGKSKNLLLYIRPTTMRYGANGYAVLTNRSNIQRAVSEFASFYLGLVAAYQARGQYPMNGPVEIRCTRLDDPGDVAVDHAESPAISALRPRDDHPEWNVAVWFDVLTFPNTAGASAFYRELEQWFFRNFSGNYAMVRPEWSKGWAYTDESAWADPTMLAQTIPDLYRVGSAPGWDWARTTLDSYDPYRIFTNSFLDLLFRSTLPGASAGSGTAGDGNGNPDARDPGAAPPRAAGCGRGI